MRGLDVSRPLDWLAAELEQLVGPAAGRYLEDLDSMDRVDVEKRRRESVHQLSPERLQGWGRLVRPLFLTDQLSLETVRDGVEGFEEEEEEANLGLAPQERLYWSTEAASYASSHWAHRSSECAAAAAGEAAAAVAAAAAASRFEFGEKLARVDGS